MPKFDPYATAPTSVYLGVLIWLVCDEERPDLPMQVVIDWHGHVRPLPPIPGQETAFELLLQARGVIELLIDFNLRGWLNSEGRLRQELCG